MTPPPQMTIRITAPAPLLSRADVSAVEPGILHAPHIVGAVDPDRDALHLRVGAGHRARVEDDRPAAIFGEIFLDLPDQPAPLLDIGLDRLPVDQLVDLGVA